MWEGKTFNLRFRSRDGAWNSYKNIGQDRLDGAT